jgi:uncharacterized protein
MRRFKVVMAIAYLCILLIIIPIGINKILGNDNSTRSEVRDNKGLIVTEQRIFDEAELLTPDEENKLMEEINRVSSKREMDIIIVTTKDVKGKTWVKYADDFYDTHDFGYDKSHGNGILLLISMDTKSTQGRGAWISSSGEVMKYFNDSRCQSIFEDIKPDLKKYAFYEACNKFISYSEDYMGLETSVPVFLTFRSVQIGIALLISVMILAFMLYRFRYGKPIDSNTYLESNSVKMNLSSDEFISKHTSVVKNSSGGNGGGGGHSSDGGFSHSGGGGSF